MAKQRSLVSAALTCVEQRCCQRAGRCWSVKMLWCLTNEQGYAALSLYGEGVVQVSVQVAHQHFGVCQAHTGWLIVDFFTARLASKPLTALAFNVIGDVRSTACVFGRVPGEKEFSCTGGSQEVSWCRGEAWHRWTGQLSHWWTQTGQTQLQVWIKCSTWSERFYSSIQSIFLYIVSVISRGFCTWTGSSEGVCWGPVESLHAGTKQGPWLQPLGVSRTWLALLTGCFCFEKARLTFCKQ